MNYMYHLYIFVGNVMFWPLTMLFSVFIKAHRFFAFLTAAIVSGIVGTLLLENAQILSFGYYAYPITGVSLAVIVVINMFQSGDMDELFYFLFSLAQGTLLGLALGYLI